jgi:hypothetical protein
MLRKMKDLKGFSIGARDGDIGVKSTILFSTIKIGRFDIWSRTPTAGCRDAGC